MKKKINIPLIGSLLLLSLVVCPILYFKLGPALNALQIETLKSMGIIAGCSALLLIVLFLGSTSLAEEISSGKYPEYPDYCKKVNKYFPGKKGF